MVRFACNRARLHFEELRAKHLRTRATRGMAPVPAPHPSLGRRVRKWRLARGFVPQPGNLPLLLDEGGFWPTTSTQGDWHYRLTAAMSAGL